MQLIEQHKEVIESLCRQYRVQRLFVFGSILSGHFSDTGDIDFLVTFEEVELSHYADNYYEFKFALERALSRSVDLIEEKAVRNPYFKQSIEANRQLLYAA